MAKVFAFVLAAALVAIFMLEEISMASWHLRRATNIVEEPTWNIWPWKPEERPNAPRNARGDAAGPNTTNPACSSVESAAKSASACPLDFMVTKLFALATTIGRPKKEDQNALEEDTKFTSFY
ncbi:hypothetical protein OROGR_007716 [Orobanche gracilis]